MVAVMSLIFYALILFLKKRARKDFLQWDKDTTTPGDFTVEMKIAKSQWELFVQRFEEVDDKNPLIIQFRDYLKKKLTKIIKKQDKIVNGDLSLEIAHIHFAFDNAKMMNLLYKRGKALINDK